jgi:hypothetical protein
LDRPTLAARQQGDTDACNISRGFLVHQVDAKLASWKKLHEQLGEAQARLKIALKREAAEGDLALLRAEVAELQVASNEALEEAQKALSAHKTQPPSGFA